MLNASEHEIYSAHKMSTTFGILTFMSRIKLALLINKTENFIDSRYSDIYEY